MLGLSEVPIFKISYKEIMLPSQRTEQERHSDISKLPRPNISSKDAFTLNERERHPTSSKRPTGRIAKIDDPQTDLNSLILTQGQEDLLTEKKGRKGLLESLPIFKKDLGTELAGA